MCEIMSINTHVCITHTHTHKHRTPTWEETKDSLIGDKKTEGLGKTKPQVKAELSII